MATKKTRHLLLLVLQFMITIVYGATIAHMTVVLFDGGKEIFLSGLIGYLSQLIILVSSLIPQIVLRVKKKLHSQDGEIYPLLFTMISLQSTLVIPKYSLITGIYFVDTSVLVVLIRFSMLGTAAIFLLSALRFYGFASSRLHLYTSLILGMAFVFCFIAPQNTVSMENILFSSIYDAYLNLISLLLYIATILTMIITAIKDKTAANIKRCISFILLISGLCLSVSETLIPTIVSSVLYITGIILLVSSTQESF